MDSPFVRLQKHLCHHAEVFLSSFHEPRISKHLENYPGPTLSAPCDMKHKVKNQNNFQSLSSLTSKKTYFHTWIFCCNVCNFVVPLERIFSSLYKDITDAIRGYYIVTCIKGTELVLNLPRGTQTVRQPQEKWRSSGHFSPPGLRDLFISVGRL